MGNTNKIEEEDEKSRIDRYVKILLDSLDAGHFIELSTLRRVPYPISWDDKEKFIRSLIIPKDAQLTSEKLEDIIVRWWMSREGWNEKTLLFKGDSDELIKQLMPFILEFARQAYERGKEGKEF